MAFIDDIKSALGVSGNDHDTEVQDLIDAAKGDLEESGIVSIDETDALTKMAITFYCKGNSRFIWDMSEAEFFVDRFEKLKAKMARTITYGIYRLTFSVTLSGSALKEATIEIDDDKETVLTTNSQGLAYYDSDIQNIDVDYTVSYSGYDAVTGTVYLDASQTEDVVIS